MVPKYLKGFARKLGVFTLLALYAGFAFGQIKSKKIAASKTQSAASSSPAAVADAAPAKVGDPGKENVAIYPFTSASGYDYEYANGVGNSVEAGFFRSARFNVVERNRFGSISREEQFKEVNTSDVVKVAAKLGAKYIITGHITGANTSEVYTSEHKFDGYLTTINVAFKIIEVESSLIKATEAMNISGRGGSIATAKGNAFASIDGVTRRLIAANFPQTFKFMAVGSTQEKKKQQVLSTFKFWGGSDNGIKVGDVVQVNYMTYVVNPNTNKKIEEKNNIGIATVISVNSGGTSTCEVYKSQKYGAYMLEVVSKSPELIQIEYSGDVKPRGFFDRF